MRKSLFITSVLIISAIQLIAQQKPYYHGLLSQPRGSFINSTAQVSKPENETGVEFTGFSGTGANINVVYHRIDWTIDPRTLTNVITGTVVTYFKTIVSNVSTITLDLHANFNNGSLVITHQGTTCSKSFSGNIVTITLTSTIVASNTLDSMVINYSGVPPVAAGAAQGYQKAGAAPNQYTGSLSESYEDRDWWPCKADMQDKIDSMDINVTVPWNNNVSGDTFWVATTGRLYDSTINGLTRTFKFSTRYPIASYLVAVSVAKFTRYHRSVVINGTTVPVVYYIMRNTTAHATKTAAMDKINPALDSFSRKFGDYPFKLEKHGFYDGLVGAGGMEHQAFSAMASSQMANLPTLIHEMAHQWFGNNVTFANWNDLWLAEGPARYAETLAAEIVPALGYTAAQVHTMRTTLKSAALALTAQSAWIPNSSMGSSALIWSSNYGSTVYERGGMVISMLRALSGNTKFYQAMTNYQTALTGKSATSDSLKNHFNAVLGTDISEFFNDYVGGSGPGASPAGGIGNPINNMVWNTPASNKLAIKVSSQTKTAGNNVAYFNGPVVMHFTNAASAWTADTTITVYDWGSGNLSYAGNGLSDPIPGNALNYNLSFTPTNAFYDDSARTMTTGTMTKDASFMGYTWNGATSSTWNTVSNWASCCAVPPDGSQVTIATTVNQPVLPGTITVGGLILNAGTTLNIGNNTLVINGAVTGTGTITGSATSNITITDAAGTLNFNQASAATRSLNNITINSGGSAKLGNAVDVYGTITLTGASLDCNAQNLTLKSTATGTARIANLTGSTLTGATNVTAERYIPNPQRSWHLLSAKAVTGSQTIFNSWQESGAVVANKGTWMTSGASLLPGFDGTSGNGSSILIHDQTVPSWTSIAVANTNATALSSRQGYMLFVRGDRTCTPANATVTPTVLKANGLLTQGTLAGVTVSATGSGRTLVGNPYASPINIEPIFSGTANLNQNMMVWDPALTGNYGVGGFRSVIRTGVNAYDQTPVVLGGTVVNDPTIQFIHSGSAFFLKATGTNASVVFNETVKAASPTTVYNPIVTTAGDQQILANLMIVQPGNIASLADGIRVRYNAAYSASLTDDIEKMGNFGENISSYRSGKKLIVEQRPMIVLKDTIFMRMTNTGIKNYRFQIGTVDFVQTTATAYLQDTWLNTVTSINLTGNVTEVDFSVTADPASANQDRFRIIFALSGPLPSTITSVKAAQKGADVEVEWKASNQYNMKQYEVEKSTDGVNFTMVNTQAAVGTNGSDATYNWLDVNPVIGNNYYRIRSIGLGSDVKISQVVKVKMGKGNPSIIVYPNPVTKRIVAVQFNEMAKGNYHVRLISTTGQVVHVQSLKHNGGSATQIIALGSEFANGVYLMEIINPDNTKTTKALVIRD